MRLYTEEYCQEILNEKNPNYKVVKVISNKDSKKDICIFSCGNQSHKLIQILSCNIKKNSVSCPECKREERYLLHKNRIINMFHSSNYIFDELYNDSEDKRTWHVLFHDINGYYFYCCYNALIKNDCVSDDIYKKIGLASPDNPYSLENIKQYILTNKLQMEFVSGDYINNRSELKCKCLKCGELFSTCWHEILAGRACGLCSDNKKRTNEEFLKLVEEQVGNEYTFLEEYRGASNPILVKHNTCNNIYPIKPVEFLSVKQRCGKCAKNSIVSEEEALDKIKSKHKNKFTLVGKFNGWTKPSNFKCNDCGNEISQSAMLIYLEKIGCMKCYYKSVTLTGNHAYIDGRTNIYHYLRKSIQSWRINNFVKWNNKCALSSCKNNNVVHHLNIPFKKIVDECHKELEIKLKTSINKYNDDDLLKLKKLCSKKHQEKVLGIVLSKEIHNEFHSLYGNINNTEEQFIEFAKSKGVDNIDDILKQKLKSA